MNSSDSKIRMKKYQRETNKTGDFIQKKKIGCRKMNVVNFSL